MGFFVLLVKLQVVFRKTTIVDIEQRGPGFNTLSSSLHLMDPLNMMFAVCLK